MDTSNPRTAPRRLSRPRRVAAAVALSCMLLGSSWPALAHGGVVPQPVVESVPDGIEARGYVAYAPRVEVTNDAGTDLTVIDDSGQPWLRISDDGVFADLTVRRWYESLDSSGRGIDPPDDAPTGWTQVSTLPRWAWFDTDLLPREDPAADHSWSIGVVVDGEFDEIQGDLQESELQGRFVTSLEGDGTVGASRVTAVSGSVPVFVVQLLEAEEVVVLGPYDEPMLRLTEAGYEVNLASPGWYEHARLDPGTEVGLAVEDPDAEPVWEMRLEGAPTATWVDPRATRGDVVPARRSESVLDFAVPVIVDGTRHDVVGTTAWQGDTVPLLPFRITIPTLVAMSLGAGLLAAAAVRAWEKRTGRDTDRDADGDADGDGDGDDDETDDAVETEGARAD